MFSFRTLLNFSHVAQFFTILSFESSFEIFLHIETTFFRHSFIRYDLASQFSHFFRDKKKFYIFIFHLSYISFSFSFSFSFSLFSYVILARLFCFFHDSLTIFRIAFVHHINAWFAFFFMSESWRFFDFEIFILIYHKKNNFQAFQTFFFQKSLLVFFINHIYSYRRNFFSFIQATFTYIYY